MPSFWAPFMDELLKYDRNCPGHPLDDPLNRPEWQAFGQPPAPFRALRRVYRTGVKALKTARRHAFHRRASAPCRATPTSSPDFADH